ncbi:unnamed protein product, partial [Rotaria sp. Silwood1]
MTPPISNNSQLEKELIEDKPKLPNLWSCFS